MDIVYLRTLPAPLACELHDPDPLTVVIDGDDRVVAVGPGAGARGVAALEGLLGQAFTALWAAPDHARLVAALADCRAAHHSVTLDVQVADDAWLRRYALTVMPLLAVGAARQVLCSLRAVDVRALPSAQARIESFGLRPDPTMTSSFLPVEEAAERLHLAESGARFASWEFDRDRCVLLTGPNYNELHGLPADTRELTLVQLGELIYAEDRPALQALMTKATRGESPPASMGVDMRVRLPDGGLRWMEARFALLPGESGRGGRILGVSIDISARKAMESSLRDSRAWLDLVMSAAGMVLWDFDLRSRELRTAGDFGRYHWLEPARGANGLESFLARVVAEDRAHVCEAFKAAVELGHEYAPTYRIALADGSLRWVASSGRVQRDASGAPERLVGVVWDVTDRHALEQRLARVAQFVPGMVYEFRRAPDGHYTFPYATGGGSARELYGVDVEAIRADAAPLLTRIHPDDFVRVMASIERSARTLETWHEEFRLHTEDSTRWLMGNSEPFAQPDGGVVWYGHLMDQTPRKLAELALRESEARLAVALSATRMMSWFWDASSDRITTSSSEFADAFGIAQGELTLSRVLDMLRPAERDAARARVQAIIDQLPDGPEVFENHIDFPSGRSRWIETRGHVHRDAAGRFLGIVCVSIDVTARRDAELERERMQRNLQQAQKMEAIGLLTGGIAHDFNNILASILGYTGLALQRFGATLPDKLADYLREVRQAGERGHELVSQMLAFSRGEGTELKRATLPPLVEQALRMVRPTLPSSLAFDFACEPGLPDVMTNPVQIQQIIVNLCINARDALGGSGALRIRLRRERCAETLCASCHNAFSGDYVVLSLADDGPGIAAEARERIFEPFFSTKSGSGGTGMGLAMVHGMVHGQGGHILLDSAPGHGTRFDVHFPCADGVADEVPPAPASVPAPSGRGRVLVVDDERAVGGFIGELLEMNDYAVQVESDPREALEALRRAPEDFDLVITDQTMPRLTGAELAVAALALKPDLPVLLISGYSAAIDAEQAARLGIRGFLAKPIKTEVLLDAVAAALRRAG